MKKLIAKLTVSAAIIGLLFTSAPAHASTPVKAILNNINAAVGAGGYEFSVYYLDPTQSPGNVVVGVDNDAVYFGTDITTYTQSELVNAVETKAIAYAATQGWSLTAADFTLFTPVPFSTAQITALTATQPSTYQALVSQSGTSAPTANQYVNDFSGTTFTWARTGTGTYTLTASNPVFTSNKTAVIMSNPPAFLTNYKYTVTSSTVITFQTATLSVLSLLLTAGNADSLLSNTMVYIIVYP